MPRVSVVLPTFNRASVLPRSVCTVLNGSFKDLELLVVDDGSTDHTSEVLGGISDERLRVTFLKKNRGANHARNVGISQARGEYIAFQDSGDEWLFEKLRRQIDTMEKHPGCQATCASYLIEDGCGKFWTSPEETYLRRIIRPTDLICRNVVDTPALFVKADLIKRLGGFDERMPRFQDWELAIRIAQETPILFTPIPMTIAHFCPNSISGNDTALEKAIDLLLEKHSTLFGQNPKKLAVFFRDIAERYFYQENTLRALRKVFRSVSCNPFALKTIYLLIAILLPFRQDVRSSMYQKMCLTCG